MYIAAKVIYSFFPLIALICLVAGIKRQIFSYIICSLWLSLIALIIHYQWSGSQILGSYFNYINAAIYSVNLILVLFSLTKISTHLNNGKPFLRYTNYLIQLFTLAASILVIINTWINAFFIENRKPGTPIIKTALLKKVEYCNYPYVFYKISTDGSVFYLCPNYYVLIPSVGKILPHAELITVL